MAGMIVSIVLGIQTAFIIATIFPAIKSIPMLIKSVRMLIGNRVYFQKGCISLLLLFNGFYPITAQNDSLREQFLPPGKLVDIGGWRLHIHGDGGTIKEGPTVILEAGAGDFSFDWSLVQPKVATFARVYSYDRAGHAWSDMGPKPHTMHQTVYNLHTLLEKADVPGPYVLIGASHGGFLVRLFAQQYPNEVAGIVLVDVGDENSPLYINGKTLQPNIDAQGIPIPPAKTSVTKSDNELTDEAEKFIRNILAQQGLPRSTLDFPYNRLSESVQKIRLWAVSQMKFYAVNDNSFYLEEAALMFKERQKKKYMFDHIPVFILTRGVPYEQDRITNQKQLLELSHNSKQIIAKKSGHHIQLEDPELVIDAIRQVIEAINKKEKLRD